MATLDPDVPGLSSATISLAVVIVELWTVSLAPFVKWIVQGMFRLAVWPETVNELVRVAEPKPLLSCDAEHADTTSAKLVIPVAALLAELNAIRDSGTATDVISTAPPEIMVLRLIVGYPIVFGIGWAMALVPWLLGGGSKAWAIAFNPPPADDRNPRGDQLGG